MQGIYTYIPETNYVPREYSVAAILLLLLLLLFTLRDWALITHSPHTISVYLRSILFT